MFQVPLYTIAPTKADAIADANCFGLTATPSDVPVDASESVAIRKIPATAFVALATEILPVPSTLIFVPTITPPNVDVVAGGK